MQPFDDQFALDDDALSKEQIQYRAAAIFLADVVLMFARLFLVVGAVWFHVLYLLLTIALTATAIQTAFEAARTIPASIPYQRAIGVVLYVSGHVAPFLFPGQLPIEWTAVVLIVYPLSIVLLFE